MKIVMTAGGSGGHITPLLAVAHELKAAHPDIQIVYIGQRGDQLSDIPAADPNVDAVYSVSAGKLRRYADEGLRQLLNVRVQALNIRDMFRVMAGLWQSYWLLHRLKPDVIFTRGGFVSVPVALAGRLRGIPYITHDSDSVPSLANRLIARWARLHAVALPKEVYPYPAARTEVVGVPISSRYQPVDDTLRRTYRQELHIQPDARVVLLTGGGNGSEPLNQALIANARYLLGTFPDLILLHIAGRKYADATSAAYDALQLPPAARARIRVEGFITDLYRHSGAADVVVARAGATTLAEFAVQGVACVIVPAAHLGWDVQNARVLAERHAVEQLTSEQIAQPERLGRTVGALLEDAEARRKLVQTFRTLARPDAAAKLAQVLITIGGEGHVRTQS